MKKSLLLFVILTCSAVTLHAYAPKGKRKFHRTYRTSNLRNFKFGGTWGPSLTSQLDHDNNHTGIQKSLLLTFHLGPFVEYKWIEELGIRLAAFYSGRGTELTAINEQGAVHSNYLLSSATLRYYPGLDRQLCAFLGPYLSYLISAELNIRKPIGRSIDLLAYDVNGELNKVDIGMVTGVDYEFGIGAIVGLTLHIGFRPISQLINTTNWGFDINWGYNLARLFY